MPTTYACDQCGHTGASLAGWLMVSIQFIHDDPNVPYPPGGRTLDSTLPDLLFHEQACVDAWRAEKGI